MKIERENLEFDTINSEFYKLKAKEFSHEAKAENYAAIYARQSINKDTNSINYQIDSCKKRLAKDKLLLYKVYEDKVSGRKIPFDARKGFSELLNDLESGMFKTVVISRRDRLTRSIEDFMKIRKVFQKNNVMVIYANEGEFDQGNRSYISNFVENIIMAIGTLEPDNIEERTSKGRQESRNKGKYNSGRNEPFGYKENANKIFDVIDEEASVVKHIFSKFLATGTIKDNGDIYSIGDLIEEINVMTKNFNIKNRAKNIKNKGKIKTFTHQSIYSIINNPIYAGYILNNAKINLIDTIEWDESNKKYKVNFDKYFVETDNISKIVDVDTWEEALIKRLAHKINAPSEPSQYLYKSILYCGCCNKEIKLIDNKYSCTNGCLSLAPIEVFTIITKQILEDIALERINDAVSPKIDALNTQLAKDKKILKAKEQDLRNHLSEYINNPSKQSLKTSLMDCKNTETNLKSNINMLGETIRLLNHKINNQESFKSELIGYIEANSKEHLENNWRIIDAYVRKFANKVVLKQYLNDYGCSVKINYT